MTRRPNPDMDTAAAAAILVIVILALLIWAAALHLEPRPGEEPIPTTDHGTSERDAR